jgi:hypothetical protein
MFWIIFYTLGFLATLSLFIGFLRRKFEPSRKDIFFYLLFITVFLGIKVVDVTMDHFEGKQIVVIFPSSPPQEA